MAWSSLPAAKARLIMNRSIQSAVWRLGGGVR